MTTKEITHHRLYNQHIARGAFTKPSQVVAWFGAMQAQDYAGSKWAIGLRASNLHDSDIVQAIANKEIVRSWPMRGTLHFMIPEDVRWMLKLMTPRVIAGSAGRYRQVDLDDAAFAHGYEVLARALQGGTQLTRKELLEIFEANGIATANLRGYHLIGRAAQDGLICYGPLRGKQQTFVLLDEWIPRGKELDHEASLAEIARRYFTAHGPATMKDFIWWTGLKAAEATHAFEMVRNHFVFEDAAGQTYWMANDMKTPKIDPNTAYLLQGFDEYMLGYADRTAALADKTNYLPPKNGMFAPTIVIDGQIVGTWRRVLTAKAVTVKAQPFTPLSIRQKQAVKDAAQKFGDYLGLPTTVSL